MRSLPSQWRPGDILIRLSSKTSMPLCCTFYLYSSSFCIQDPTLTVLLRYFTKSALEAFPSPPYTRKSINLLSGSRGWVLSSPTEFHTYPRYTPDSLSCCLPVPTNWKSRIHSSGYLEREIELGVLRIRLPIWVSGVSYCLSFDIQWLDLEF
jgi:hypothetical protein